MKFNTSSRLANLARISCAFDSSRVTSLTANLEGGNQLVLDFQKGSKFASFKEADMFQLFFAERYEGRYDDEPAKPGDHYFMTTDTEYFPSNKAEEAVAAFMVRLTADNPAEATGTGYRLEDFLEKDN